jgi:N-acylneuraminate cytidylyltransferase
MVSTDDPSIAEHARNNNALVPWLRPLEFSGDLATSAQVALHALNWYEAEKGQVDGLLLLQPTSPLRTRETVMRGIELFITKGCRPVVGLSPAGSHPYQCFSVDGDRMRSFISGEGVKLRSQDLPPAFVVNGAFYLISPMDLRRMNSFYSDDAVPLLIDKLEESIDIDTEWDWKLAEVAHSLSSVNEIQQNNSIISP